MKRLFLFPLILALLIALAPGARAAATYTVTSTADTDGTTCAAACTLRQAINAANANAGTDTINFNIAGGAPHTITPVSDLPTITDPVIIDGMSEPSYAGTPVVVIDGSQHVDWPESYAVGLHVTADNTTIKGLVIHSFYYGIALEMTEGVVIEGNFIGTDHTGMVGIGQGSGLNPPIGSGIVMYASNTRIGGTVAGTRNVIAGYAYGIEMSNESSNNLIQGNLIGTNWLGTAALPNRVGIIIASGGSPAPSNNQIGGTTNGSGNTISGNSSDAIQIYTWTMGDADPPSGTIILRNQIGTTSSGTGSIPNGTNGVGGGILDYGDGTMIGDSEGNGNRIANNAQYGIKLYDAINTVIKGNTITKNGAHGIQLTNSTSDVGIGGLEELAGNTIAENGSIGVLVETASDITIRRNSIHSNTSLGIDLDNSSGAGDGVTPNDPGDTDTGANGLQNFPVITTAQLNSMGTVLTVEGTLNSTADGTFTIDLYANGTTTCNGSTTHGQGHIYLGSTEVTTNGSGNGTFSTTFVVTLTEHFRAIAATATSPTANTSEFSLCQPITQDPIPPTEPDPPSDFNGDGISEVVIFRGGAWHMYNYSDGSVLISVWTGLGSATARPLMMDYDGDGTDNLAIYDAGAWHFFNNNGSYLKGIWTGGQAADLPVPADYDGNGTDDPVIFRGGAWLWFDFATGAWDAAKSVWTGPGAGGTVYPAPADYDGDGDADFSTYTTAGAWHFFNEDGSYLKGLWVAFINTIPIPADYDGDGDDDVMLWQQAGQGGAWHHFDYATGAYSAIYTATTAPHKYGLPLMPAPLDTDGDGDIDRSIYLGGPWNFFAYDGGFIKNIPTGGVAGDKDVSGRPALP